MHSIDDIKPDPKTYFGENLKAARKAKKITQQQLANAIGVNIATIRGYENNLYKPKYNKLMDIARHLGVRIAYLQSDHPLRPGSSIRKISANDVAAQKDAVSKVREVLGEGVASSCERYFALLNTGAILRAESFAEMVCEIAEEKALPDPDPEDGFEEDERLSRLIETFDRLNPDGQEVAIARVGELTEIPRYVKKIYKDM